MGTCEYDKSSMCIFCVRIVSAAKIMREIAEIISARPVKSKSPEKPLGEESVFRTCFLRACADKNGKKEKFRK